MTDASLESWLQRLERLHPKQIDLGLERVRTVAGRMGLLRPRAPVITVAGTNGKGSTVAVLEALLLERGLRPGAYTSPHLLRFSERIRIAGEPVPDEQIAAAFGAIDAARGEVSLTYFEFATLAALHLFAAAQVDYLLLEVGLGGRLDAVNIVDPDVAVITSIGFDHRNWLGDSRDDIAREKAGILRPGIPVVIAEPDPPAALLARVREAAGPARFWGRDFGLGAGGGYLCDARGRRRDLPGVADGSLRYGNIAAALQALSLLGVEVESARLAPMLSGLVVAGRLQCLEIAGIEYLLDVAHNPESVKVLLEFINSTHCNGKNIALFAVMSDKEIEAMIRAAARQFDAWYLPALPAVSRSEPPDSVAALLREAGQHMISISATPRQALQQAREVLRRGDRLVVFGSFHTVGEVLPELL